jgi:bacterioferritin-associated ferredoxin
MAKVMACRCEDVTLHELEDAIARGHTDLESLKRYTGFGTGWCQVKSCVPVCARVLVERGGSVSLPITPRPPFHPLPLADLAGLAEIADEDARNGRPPH